MAAVESDWEKTDAFLSGVEAARQREFAIHCLGAAAPAAAGWDWEATAPLVHNALLTRAGLVETVCTFVPGAGAVTGGIWATFNANVQALVPPALAAPITADQTMAAINRLAEELRADRVRAAERDKRLDDAVSRVNSLTAEIDAMQGRQDEKLVALEKRLELATGKPAAGVPAAGGGEGKSGGDDAGRPADLSGSSRASGKAWIERNLKPFLMPDDPVERLEWVQGIEDRARAFVKLLRKQIYCVYTYTDPKTGAKSERECGKLQHKGLNVQLEALIRVLEPLLKSRVGIADVWVACCESLDAYAILQKKFHDDWPRATLLEEDRADDGKIVSDRDHDELYARVAARNKAATKGFKAAGLGKGGGAGAGGKP